MQVWVIVSDLGLNGVWVHGVRSQEPTEEDIAALWKEPWWQSGVRGTTVEMFELDGPSHDS